jgi:hypothetical protein
MHGMALWGHNRSYVAVVLDGWNAQGYHLLNTVEGRLRGSGSSTTPPRMKMRRVSGNGTGFVWYLRGARSGTIGGK